MIEGKKVLVAGFARTGRSVVEFLKTKPCRISVSESRPASEFPAVTQQYPDVEFEFGGHQEGTFRKADLIVISPGIPDTLPAIQSAMQRGIPVISEIELAYHYLHGTLVGITGTNGKSTTTELAGAMLKAGGKNAIVCGNIGTPLIEYCNQSKPEQYYVVELSSFQLETIDTFRPHIAAIINLAEDHLDRYPSIEPYFRAKMRIFKNQRENDYAVLNYDDPYLKEHAGEIPSHVFWFSRNTSPPAGIYAADNLVKVVSGASVVNFAMAGIRGVHNLENTLCAASIALLCGVRVKAMQQALENFTGLHHRMEFVGKINGVAFYDDSKATNTDAVLKSLQSFPGNIILIMGGRDKGCDYRVLSDLVSSRVKRLLLIGEAKERIAKELKAASTPEFFTSLEEAVQSAAHNADPGDVVLLSPACSSFDMFENYEHRGRVFRETAHKLGAEK